MTSRVFLTMLKQKDNTSFSRLINRTIINSCSRKNSPCSANRATVAKFSSDFPSKCWKCEFPQKSKLFCHQCKTLQKPPEDINFFDLIGIKMDYNVVTEEIQKNYRQLQMLLHPDKFGNRTEGEKAMSENCSSLLNKAYKTLLDPLDRGLYMLKLQDAPISESTTQMDPEFLMTIMEKNEEIDDAKENKEKLLKLIEENRKMLNTLTKEISKAFRDGNLDEAKALLTKMKYYSSINSRLKNLKNEHGIVD